MTSISDVNLMSTKSVIPHRDKKYCVCISTGKDKDKYFLIDSKSRKMYDDFEIKAKEYEFLEHDSYISCSLVVELENERFIEKLGNINHKDMVTILKKVKNSEYLSNDNIKDIESELGNWLKDDNYANNKLSAVFKCR